MPSWDDRDGVDAAQVRAYEEMGWRSWPPREHQELGGWVLRASGGTVRRANSAWPRKPCTLPPDRLLAATRSWYEARGLPPMVQLSPVNEPDLAPHLAGWEVGPPALVLAGPLRAEASDAVRVAGWPDADWWTVAGLDPEGPVAGALGRISKPAAYAVAYDGGEPVAAGRCVVDGRQMGVFTLSTLEAHRGRGHGRRVMGALGAYAAGLGATATWLQVHADNAPALALYADLTPVYAYAYATVPG